MARDNKIGIIIAREYYERVRKKSFIIVTLLMPIFMIALMVAPALLMTVTTGDTKVVDVIDKSGLILPKLESDQALVFAPAEQTLDSLRVTDNGHFGVLYIPADVVDRPDRIRLYANEASSVALEENINGQLSKIIEDIKLRDYNIENIDKILADVRTNVSVQVLDNSTEGESSTSTLTSFAIGTLLGFILYMFLILYGQMVMTSVIEEKGNRVLEVLVSSCTPFQMMMGKILGVALVALTQIAIWGVLITAAAAVLPALLPPDVAADMVASQAGNQAFHSNVDADTLSALTLITDLRYIINIFFWFIMFAVFGFLFYAALFAAAGSAVDNIQDAGQLTTPIMLPIIIALLLEFTIINDPNSSLAFWFSMIPFTSPIVMLARVPFGIPLWQPALSLVLLVASFVAATWLAGKIYRVGIFMYGKKPSLKEIVRWVKYK